MPSSVPTSVSSGSRTLRSRCVLHCTARLRSLCRTRWTLRCAHRAEQPARFQVFKTLDGRGWALRATADIPADTFVVEYQACTLATTQRTACCNATRRSVLQRRWSRNGRHHAVVEHCFDCLQLWPSTRRPDPSLLASATRTRQYLCAREPTAPQPVGRFPRGAVRPRPTATCTVVCPAVPQCRQFLRRSAR